MNVAVLSNEIEGYITPTIILVHEFIGFFETIS